MNMQQRVRLNVDRGLTSLADLDRRVVLAFLFGALALLAVIVLATRAGGSAAAPIGPTPVNVLEARPASEFERVSTYLGRVEPIQESGIGFEIGGAITSVLVDEGQSFGRGAPLARLDIDLLRHAAGRTRRPARACQGRAAARRQHVFPSRRTGTSEPRRGVGTGNRRGAVRGTSARGKCSPRSPPRLAISIRRSVRRRYAPRSPAPCLRGTPTMERWLPPALPSLRSPHSGSPRVRVGLPTDVAAEAQSSGKPAIPDRLYRVCRPVRTHRSNTKPRDTDAGCLLPPCR